MSNALQELHKAIEIAFPGKLFIDTEAIDKYLQSNADKHAKELTELIRDVLHSMKGGNSII